MKNLFFSAVFILMIGNAFLFAEGKKDLDFAQVTAVKTVRQGETWTFYVTVRHNDEGWKHYANVWQVIDPETETVLAERVLAHPHDNEQPFTRSLSGITFPEEISVVTVRAGCNLHGFGGAEIAVNLSTNGENSDG